ncbi:MAG: nuclear transport factor 2 family protein [Acidobacteriota bacterium]|jgi:ketosteroid isomerase-like protein|nr:nuclear transport factor 2 family protein [Acidobacteriota bacterium]
MSGKQPARDSSRIQTEQELRRMNDDWVKALVRADGATLDRIMADDFFFAYPMEGDDKAQFIGDVVSGDVKVEFLTRENVGVRIWGSTAVLTGKDSAKWYYKGRDFSGHYKIIHIYSLRDDRWQLVSVQACPMT